MCIVCKWNLLFFYHQVTNTTIWPSKFFLSLSLDIVLLSTGTSMSVTSIIFGQPVRYKRSVEASYPVLLLWIYHSKNFDHYHHHHSKTFDDTVVLICSGHCQYQKQQQSTQVVRQSTPNVCYYCVTYWVVSFVFF